MTELKEIPQKRSDSMEHALNAGTSALPDLHRQAFLVKNRKRFQHDGGRAWIRDGQLHDSLKNGNYRLERGKPLSIRLEGIGREILEKRTGELIHKTNSYRKL